MKVSGAELSSMFVYDVMLTTADEINGLFPHHSKSMRDELLKWRLVDGTWYSSPQTMTETRWNRLADILGSLASLPGSLFDETTRHLRLRALCLAEAPRAMARHCFGGKRAFGALDLAVYIASEYSTPKAA